MQVLVVLVPISVCSYESPSLGVALILHLMKIIFDANLAEVTQGARYSRHAVGG